MKTKALVFISALVLVFVTAACKQSGEAEKPVKKAAETPAVTIESDVGKTVEKAGEAVSDAVEEVSRKVDETVSNTVDEVNKKVKQIEKLLGDNCRAHETLFSSAILKKTGLRLAA